MINNGECLLLFIENSVARTLALSIGAVYSDFLVFYRNTYWFLIGENRNGGVRPSVRDQKE